jgi:hypothetical protein
MSKIPHTLGLSVGGRTDGCTDGKYLLNIQG